MFSMRRRDRPRRAPAVIFFFLLALALAPGARADWLAEEDARAAAERDGVPAAVLVQAVTTTASGAVARASALRRDAFRDWADAAIPALDLVRERRLVLARVGPGRKDYAPLGVSDAEGGVVVRDWQWAVVAVVKPIADSARAAVFSRDLKKALARAEAQGEAKRRLVRRLERDLAAMEADLKAQDLAPAIARGQAIVAEKPNVRAAAIDRAEKVLHDLHDRALARIREIDDERDKSLRMVRTERGDRTYREPARDWADKTLRLVVELRKQFSGFKDVIDALADREARAAAVLQQYR